MAGLIDDAIRSYRPAMDARLQQFNVCVSSCALLVNGDPVRLTEIMCNLLDNASKYTPIGGEIALAVTAAEGSVVMEVSDNGIGITPDALSRVFEPFVQDGHAIAFNGAGLGIGLTVVRELVEAHGGRVVASSAGSGLGSQFVVTLPSIDEWARWLRPSSPWTCRSVKHDIGIAQAHAEFQSLRLIASMSRCVVLPPPLASPLLR